ncbi:hypothetical protein PRIPAC_87342 [Pristionchus pacificus]|uniref:Uncharacterized protein n=1 Tax=Pristionchus pacificus TaxID=54126 RepID=A0A2A6CX31_PRIPA|nr:hypothetical protein PRIPAC_87342 [Pristionchus pacificus]|eukprot:PDM82719.1 hypothetical protein PRIPAC_37112 [Pristionchus pacificus]
MRPKLDRSACKRRVRSTLLNDALGWRDIFFTCMTLFTGIGYFLWQAIRFDPHTTTQSTAHRKDALRIVQRGNGRINRRRTRLASVLPHAKLPFQPRSSDAWREALAAAQPPLISRFKQRLLLKASSSSCDWFLRSSKDRTASILENTILQYSIGLCSYKF